MAAEADGAGGGRDNVVVFGCLFRSWLPSSNRKEWDGIEVTDALPGEHNDVRAGEAMPLQSAEKGSEMELSWSPQNRGRRYYARVDAMVSPIFLCSFLSTSLM